MKSKSEPCWPGSVEGCCLLGARVQSKLIGRVSQVGNFWYEDAHRCVIYVAWRNSQTLISSYKPVLPDDQFQGQRSHHYLNSLVCSFTTAIIYCVVYPPVWGSCRAVSCSIGNSLHSSSTHQWIWLFSFSLLAWHHAWRHQVPITGVLLPK